ncbi:MAG TPA: PLP-dependent aminotransferase family protein [Gemmatimonadaceae bacterium]|nr:PLP-dependent aminotransferase family protein [Gemmatimonadaceae bacterium]
MPDDSARGRRPTGHRVPSAPSILVRLDTTRDEPLHHQVYADIRDAILAGRIAARSQLPSTRLLAKELEISRTTVSLAFDQLRAEGFLDTRERGGTYVAATIPDRALSVARHPVRRPAAHPRPTTRANSPPIVSTPSRRGAALAALATPSIALSRLQPRAFRSGVPSLDAFPHRVWGQISARLWRRAPRALLAYGVPNGHEPLRKAIAHYLEASRGARCSSEQVIVVGGSQEALYLAAHLLIEPGESAWIENPGYPGARNALSAAGARLVGVPLDAEGLDISRGRTLAPDARIAYVTPSHQYPLGVTMSIGRRLAMLDWARESGAWILEDDYDSEFRYSSRPLPSLQGLDAAGGDQPARVIYIGSFSKTLFPALRIGFLVVPPMLVDAFSAARSVIDRQSPTFEQAVLAEFIAEGHFVRHVRRMRALYAERQHALLRGIEYGPLMNHIESAPSDAGMHLVGWLRHVADDRRASSLALDDGIEAQPLSAMSLGGSARAALLLGYAAFTPATLLRSSERLASVLDGLRRQSPAAGRSPNVAHRIHHT